MVALGCDAAVAQGQDAWAGGGGRISVGDVLLVLLGLLLHVGDGDPGGGTIGAAQL